MKCYYHQSIEAIAICKSCSRALCKDCAADVPPGTACVNRCEEDVATLNMIIARSKFSFQKTGKAYKRNAIALVLVGSVFLFIGVFPILVNENYGSSFMAVLGFIFFLWAYFSYSNGKQIESLKENA